MLSRKGYSELLGIYKECPGGIDFLNTASHKTHSLMPCRAKNLLKAIFKISESKDFTIDGLRSLAFTQKAIGKQLNISGDTHHAKWIFARRKWIRSIMNEMRIVGVRSEPLIPARERKNSPKISLGNSTK